jgi:hypothetical protein
MDGGPMYTRTELYHWYRLVRNLHYSRCKPTRVALERKQGAMESWLSIPLVVHRGV